MRALIIDAAAKAEIKRVMDYADTHRLSIRDLISLLAHPENAPGNSPERRCHINMGFKVCFTIEQQQDGKWWRHISVSVDGGKWPHELAVSELAKEFGFVARYRDRITYLEREVRAVNVLERLEKKPENTHGGETQKHEPVAT